MNWNQVPSELQSMTDAELEVLLPKLTSSNIKKSELKVWLQDNGYAYRNFQSGGDAYTGPLPEIAKNPAMPAGIQQGLSFLFGVLLESEIDVIRTATEPYGGQTYDVIQGLVALGTVTVSTGDFTFNQAHADEFFDLGGGRPFKDETQATIAAARQKVSDDSTFDTDWTYVENHYLNVPVANKDKATTIQNLKDAATWWESQ